MQRKLAWMLNESEGDKMSKTQYGWRCTDPDCAQYMKRDGDWFEMIQVVEPNDSDAFFVLRDGAWFSDCTEEEQADAIAAYGYTLDELYRGFGKEEAEDLIMECFLEQSIICNGRVVAESNSFKKTEEMVKLVITKGEDGSEVSLL